jgi:hypothetical protein
VVGGDRCIYCGIPNDGKYDHQPSVYVLHRFAPMADLSRSEASENVSENADWSLAAQSATWGWARIKVSMTMIATKKS